MKPPSCGKWHRLPTNYPQSTLILQLGTHTQFGWQQPIYFTTQNSPILLSKTDYICRATPPHVPIQRILLSLFSHYGSCPRSLQPSTTNQRFISSPWAWWNHHSHHIVTTHSPCYLMQFPIFWFIPPHGHALLQSPYPKSPNAHSPVCPQHTFFSHQWQKHWASWGSSNLLPEIQ